MSVEVAGGPTVGLKSTVKLPRCVRDTSKNGDESDQKRSNRSGFFLEEIKEEEEEEEEEERRSEASSIGVCSSADEKEEEEEEEVQSKESVEEKKSSLSSLDSLEDSLPIKRGLSNFYSGKSKSFTSLSNAGNATARDLRKPENPFNKRRRIQQMAAWSRRASCSSLLLSSMAGSSPTLSEYEKEEVEVEEEVEEEMPLMRRGKGKRPSLFTCTPLPIWGGDNEKMAPLKSPRSFSLSDLTKHAQHLD